MLPLAALNNRDFVVWTGHFVSLLSVIGGWVGVFYPVAQVQNAEAEELESTAAKEFVDFLITDDAKTIFQKYYFDTDVED